METETRPYSAAQLAALLRLTHVVTQEREHDSRLPGVCWQRKLIARAKFSLYLDCLALGVGDAARTVIARGAGTAA